MRAGSSLSCAWQKPTTSNGKVAGTPPICLFDTSYSPRTTEVACPIGEDVDTLITYVNDSVITGVVNRTCRRLPRAITTCSAADSVTGYLSWSAIAGVGGLRHGSARGASGGDAHALVPGSTGGEVLNNTMVATRSISLERGGASHESSASSAQMARLYVCAYLPVSVAHSTGCN